MTAHPGIFLCLFEASVLFFIVNLCIFTNMWPSTQTLTSGVLITAALLVLGACSSGSPLTRHDGSTAPAMANPTDLPQPIQGASSWRPEQTAQWREVRLPGKVPTEYRLVSLGGQSWLRADARRSASLLSQVVDIDVRHHGRIRFDWRIELALHDADVALRDKEDSPVRLMLAFDGDRSEFSTRDAAMSELTQLMTGEPLPYATLMYVWCAKREIGTVVHNPRTDRIRKIVVANPRSAPNGGLVERDIVTDYQQAYGRSPGRLIGIAIMSDSDNTKGSARALYGPIEIW
jgi:hypothetical protein